MRKLIGLAATILVSIALFAGATQTPPTLSELSTLRGVAGKTHIIPATRRSPEFAMLQVLISPNEHRLVKTFDVQLAQSVSPDLPIEIKLHEAHSLLLTSTPEIWALEQDGIIKRSYNQSLAVRGAQITKSARNYKLFSAYAIVFIGAAILICKRNAFTSPASVKH